MRRLHPNRQGLTLVELLLLISISSLLMTIIGIWLHKLMLFSSLMLERQRDHAGFRRLASELRQDVQLAKAWSFPQPNELELVLADDTTITYRILKQPNGSQVHAIYPLQPDSASPQPGIANRRHEIYRFTPNCQLKWVTDDFPDGLTLVAYRLPTLAHPLPAPNSTPSNNPAATGGAAVGSAGSKSQRSLEPDSKDPPVDALIQLRINRWSGHVLRYSEEQR